MYPGNLLIIQQFDALPRPFQPLGQIRPGLLQGKGGQLDQLQPDTIGRHAYRFQQVGYGFFREKKHPRRCLTSLTQVSKHLYR